MPRSLSPRLRKAPRRAPKYASLIENIVATHSRAHAGAMSAVNRHLTLRNWLIGAHIVEFEQLGEDRAAYGERLLSQLARDLRQRSIPGCSVEMLGRMRLFYRMYPQLTAQISAPAVTKSIARRSASLNAEILSPPVTESGKRLPTSLSSERLLQLSWSHFIELVRLEDPWKRAFYENECLRGNWSKRELQRQVGSLLYERTGLSIDRRATIERSRQSSVEKPGDMASLIRDPYVVEFVGLAERHYTENELETALLNHVQRFLLELGTGFCFEARQKRISVGDEHDYIDLVFYHRLLRCHVLIELKVRPFQHGDAGQMNYYVNYWKAECIGPGDNPPVGLLLCSDKSQTKVEYATGGLDKQLFVSRYLVALPKAEELQQFIEHDRATWEEQR